MGVTVDDLDPANKHKKAAAAAAAARNAISGFNLPSVSEPTDEEEEELADPHTSRIMESFEVLESHKTHVEAEMALLKKQTTSDAKVKFEDLSFELQDTSDRIAALQDAVESGTLTIDAYKKKVEIRMQKDRRLLAFMVKDSAVFGAESISRMKSRIQLAQNELSGGEEEEEEETPVEKVSVAAPSVSQKTANASFSANTIPTQQQQPPSQSKNPPVAELQEPLSCQWMSSFEVLTAHQEALDSMLSTRTPHASLPTFPLSLVEDELTKTLETLADLQERIENGSLSLEDYSRQVTDRLHADKRLALALKAANRIPEAVAVLKRVKIAEEELKAGDDQQVNNQAAAPSAGETLTSSKNIAPAVSTLTTAETQLKERVLPILETRHKEYLSCLRALMALNDPEAKKKASEINESIFKTLTKNLDAFKLCNGQLLSTRLNSREDQKAFVASLPPRPSIEWLTGLNDNERKEEALLLQSKLEESAKTVENHILRLMRSKEENLKKAALPLHSILKQLQSQIMWIKHCLNGISNALIFPNLLTEQSLSTVDIIVEEGIPMDELWIEIWPTVCLPETKAFAPFTESCPSKPSSYRYEEQLEMALTGRCNRRPVPTKDRPAAQQALKHKQSALLDRFKRKGSKITVNLDAANNDSLVQKSIELKSELSHIDDVITVKISIAPLLRDMTKLRRALTRFKLGIDIEVPRTMSFLRGARKMKIPAGGRHAKLEGLLTSAKLEGVFPIDGDIDDIDTSVGAYVRVRTRKAMGEGETETAPTTIKFNMLKEPLPTSF